MFPPRFKLLNLSTTTRASSKLISLSIVKIKFLFLLLLLQIFQNYSISIENFTNFAIVRLFSKREREEISNSWWYTSEELADQLDFGGKWRRAIDIVQNFSIFDTHPKFYRLFSSPKEKEKKEKLATFITLRDIHLRSCKPTRDRFLYRSNDRK